MIYIFLTQSLIFHVDLSFGRLKTVLNWSSSCFNLSSLFRLRRTGGTLTKRPFSVAEPFHDQAFLSITLYLA